jgi:hypothetical protein
MIFNTLFLIFAFSPATPKATCLGVIKWSGTVENISIIKEALSGGPLLMQRAERCKGVKIHVYFKNKKWSFQLIRNKLKVVHKLTNIQDAKTWIESFLVPPKSIIMPPVTKLVKAKTPTKTVIKKPKLKNPEIKTKSGVPVLVGIKLGGSYANEASGISCKGELSVQISKRLWAGVAFDYFYSDLHNNLELNSYSTEVKGGLKFSTGSFRILPGAGIGYMVTQEENYNIGNGITVDLERVDFNFSVFINGEYIISPKLRFIAGVSVQFNPFDGDVELVRDSSNGGQGLADFNFYKDDLKREMILYFTLGFAWNFGGWI